MKKICMALMLILMLLLFLIACEEQVNVQLTEIIIDSDTIQEFYIQDNNDLTDVSLTATFSDGTTKQISISDTVVTGLDMSIIGVQTVTITYKGKTTTIDIEVVPPTCTIQYIAGENGTISGEANQTVPYGEDASTVRAIPNENYVFSGWSDNYNNPRRSDKEIKSDISVTANFIENTYDVKFYSRNGNLLVTESVVKNGAAVGPSVDLLVEEGFDFTGWTKRSNGGSVDLTNISADIDVIATYTAKKVNVKFYNSNGVLISNSVINYGESVTPPTANTIYGYAFSNWVIKETTENAIFSNIISDKEFEPVYSPVSFNITFDSNGGTAVSPMEVVYQASPIDLPASSKTGMSFQGWFTALEGGNAFNESSIINGNITVYARWSVMNCTMYFNTTGGTSISSQTVVYGNKIIPPARPTKVGYTFIDWYNSEIGGTTYNFNTILYNNNIIYAHWTPLNYTIQFMALGGTAVSNVIVPYDRTILSILTTTPTSTKEGNVLRGWTLNTVTNALYDFNTPISGAITLYAVWQEEMVTVNATSIGGGSVNPNGAISIGYDKSVVITITPSIGYRIKTMSVNGISISPSNTYTLNRSWHTLYVEFEIIKYDIIATIKSSGGTVTPSGKSTVDYGSSLIYNITPNVGYKIDLVRVNNVSVGALTTYTFSNITSNNIIDVYFSLITFTVTSTATSGGTISPQGTVLIGYGSSKNYTITPGSNYHIAYVRVNGVNETIANNKTAMVITIPNITVNTTIAATFEGDTYSITASAGLNGSISPSGTTNANFGSSILFTMIPNTGYKVSEITVNGNVVGSTNTYNFTTNVLSSDNTISVTFELCTYSTNYSIIGSGVCTINNSVPVTHGDVSSFTITPSVNYHLGLTTFAMGGVVYNLNAGDDNTIYSFIKTSNIYTLTVKSVIGEVNVNISFAIDTYTIDINPGVNGKVIINSLTTVTSHYVLTVNYGASTVLAIMPNTGYHISLINKDGTILTGYNTSTHNLNINSISTNQEVTTAYTINSYNIEMSVDGNGSIFYNGNPVTSIVTNYGTTPSITIVPAIGYHIKTFSVNAVNITVPTNNIYTFNTISNDMNINVVFEIDLLSIQSMVTNNGAITWEAGYNSITYDDITYYLQIPYGEDVIYTFTPNANYHIDYLRVKLTSNEEFITLSNGYNDSQWEYTIVNGIGTLKIKNIIEDRDIDVSFIVNTYTITASVIDSVGGTISPSGDRIINHGGNITYNITPNSNYNVEGVYLDDVLLEGVELSYTFINVTANHTIKVKFILKT